ncbi:MAG: hypothetical protein JRI23_34585 [Deltaproteobacteria bacterium]|jgi:hypothetical protein|nr:hypothetical protein [Deltaproteobacteria bacterium]MBW2537427.1 hypothetical protein [Deltaproteobacteria bacterium]
MPAVFSRVRRLFAFDWRGRNAEWAALGITLVPLVELARSYSTRLPHTDVQGSFAKALLVEQRGGLGNVAELWEHRTTVHGFVTFLVHWLGAPLRALGLEHHVSMLMVLVLASAAVAASCMAAVGLETKPTRPGWMAGLLLLTALLLSPTYWMVGQSEHLAVLVGLAAVAPGLSRRWELNLLAGALLAVAFLLKMTTGVVSATVIVGLWLLAPRRFGRVVTVAAAFVAVSALLAALLVIEASELERLLISVYVNADPSVTWSERLKEGLHGAGGALLQLPAIGFALALAPTVFGRLRRERGWLLALAYAALWPLNLAPVFATALSFPYHLSGIMALVVVTFVLELRPGGQRIAGERALTAQLLTAVVVFALVVNAWLHDKRLVRTLHFEYPEVVLSGCLAGYVAVVLLLRRSSRRRHFVTLCCSLVLLTAVTAGAVDYGGRDYQRKRRDGFAEARTWVTQVNGGRLAEHEVLYLASARGAYLLRAPPACNLVYSTVVKAWRKRPAAEQLEPLESARWYRKCATRYQGNFVVLERKWFRPSAITKAGLRTMLRAYQPLADHGTWQLYCRKGSEHCR